jgi:hypothetical protein
VAEKAAARAAVMTVNMTQCLAFIPLLRVNRLV